MWLLLAYPLLGTWPATQACALTGNRTEDPLIHRAALNPLSHTSQDWNFKLKQLDTMTYLPEWLKSKTLTETKAVENVEQQELSLSAGREAEW